jgi:uncharacterized membrane protein YgcG
VLTASVDADHVFVRWYGDQDCWDEDENDGLPETASVSVGAADVQCSAMAVPSGSEYALTVEKTAGGNGRVTATATPASDTAGLDCPLAACAQNFPANSQIQLIATPDRGSVFAGWDGDADCVDGLVTMSNNLICSARFTDRILLVDGSDDANKRSEYLSVFSNIDGSDVDEWSVQSPNSTSNPDGRAEPLATDLAPYSRVVWYSGNASADRDPSPAAGPSDAAETELGDWLDAGGCLLLSSPQYFRDRGITPFARSYLGIDAISEDAGESELDGAGQTSRGFSQLGPYLLNYSSAGLLAGISDAVIGDPSAPGIDTLLSYANVGDAAIGSDSPNYRTAFFAFPFLALNSGNDRIEVMNAFLDYCQQPDFDDAFESNGDFDSASAVQGEVSLSDLRLLPGDEDFFVWLADSYRNAQISIGFDDAVSELLIEVYDNARTLIGNASPAAVTSVITLVNVDAGNQYFLRIRHANPGSTASQRYRLSITAVGPSDHDHDGTPDDSDAFPEDASEQADADGDWIGDNADPDDDNDGMSDAFEQLYGLDPHSADDAAGDNDGDGFSNAEEAAAGSDPLDASSLPTIEETTLVAVPEPPPTDTGGGDTGGGDTGGGDTGGGDTGGGDTGGGATGGGGGGGGSTLWLLLGLLLRGLPRWRRKAGI